MEEICNRRNTTLDIAKCLGIVLMVIGHCYHFTNIILVLIYGFHMPFFFIVSGLIYGEKHRNGSYAYSWRKAVTGLIIPYFFYEILYICFLAALGLLSSSPDVFSKFLSQCKRMIAFSGVTVTWYLPCIAITEMVFMFLYSKKSVAAYVCAALFAVPGLFLREHLNGIMFTLARAGIGMSFFAVGFAVGKFNNQEKNNKKIMVFCLPILSLLYYIAAKYNGMVSLVNLKVNNPAVYLIAALLGSTLLLIIAQLLSGFNQNHKLPAFLYMIGQNTLFILGTHMILVEAIRLIDYKLFHDSLKKLGLGEGIVFGMIVCLLEICMIPAYRKVKHALKNK